MKRTHYVAEIDARKHAGKRVTVAGWTHEIRDFGAVKFVILRDRTGLIQLTFKKGGSASATALKNADALVKETAIACTGIVVEKTVAGVGRELLAEELEIISPVLKQVPFEVTGKVPADIDVRLNHRIIDLRRPETTAVFKIRSEAQRAFRDACYELGCQEITPPCLVSSSTEGGANLFSLKYFEQQAFLAQSPQLYKQLAVLGGMDRVFMITPVFRAEKHNTTTHLNEVTQMDVEIGFADANDALDALEKVTLHILAHVKKNCARELEMLGSKISVPKKISRHDYDEIVEALNSSGVEFKWGEDFPKDVEEKIPELFGEELFFITNWPTKTRAFYSMPFEEKPDICKAYDLIYKGLEIASGAQRIHDPNLLVQQLKLHGLHPHDFESYIDAFRYGAPPHAGWSIGLERLTMKLANRSNIRECSLFPRDRHRLTP